MTSVFPAASAPADVLPSVPVRGVRAPELPSSLVFAHSDAAVADALAQTLAELELRRPLFALGRAGRNLLGRSLVIDCGAQLECATVETAGATLDEVDRLQHVALEEKADVIISCGGRSSRSSQFRLRRRMTASARQSPSCAEPTAESAATALAPRPPSSYQCMSSAAPLAARSSAGWRI